MIAVTTQHQLCANSKYSIPDMSESHLVIGEPSAVALDPQSIKILVWNIYKGQRENWSKDFTILAEKADLLLVQEGYLNPLMQEVFYYLRFFRFDFGISFLYQEEGGIPTGTTVGSKVKPFKSGLLRTVDTEPLIGTPKTITFGYYPITGFNKKVLVLNIHGLNVTKQEALERQILSANEIIAKHDGPVIFAGDFNTRTKNRMKFLRSKMQEVGLQELTFLDDDRMSFMGNPLDHVFVRNFSAKEARVLPSIESSDHKPIYLELRLEK